MRFNRETRRTVAQFLNGMAVSVVATLVLAPVATGAFNGIATVIALIGAVLVHLLALAVCTSR